MLHSCGKEREIPACVISGMWYYGNRKPISGKDREESGMETTRLWPGGPVVSLTGDGGSFADSMLLADFALHHAGHNTRQLCDLGCGCGNLAILLLCTLPEAAGQAVERRREPVRLARQLAEENGLSQRLRVWEGDLREPLLLPYGQQDLVVMNPPYFEPARGKAAPDADRDDARRENHGDLESWLAAAARLLRPGGRLFLCHRAQALSRVLCGMEAVGLSPKWLRCVHHAPSYPGRLILVGGQKQAGVGLELEAPLYLKNPAGEDSEEIRRIYHRTEEKA